MHARTRAPAIASEALARMPRSLCSARAVCSARAAVTRNFIVVRSAITWRELQGPGCEYCLLDYAADKLGEELNASPRAYHFDDSDGSDAYFE